MARSDARVDVRLRVLTRKAPGRYHGRSTAFGLQEKKDRASLLKGKSTGSVLAFDFTARAKEEGGSARFYGSLVKR